MIRDIRARLGLPGAPVVVVAGVLVGVTLAAQSPSPMRIPLTNGHLNLVIRVPDYARGEVFGTRFDSAGVIDRLEYRDHVYYQPWFTRADTTTRDYTVNGAEIVAGPNTAFAGPVEEFQGNLGYDEVAPGGTFVKIGVGILRKPDDANPYSNFRSYDVVDAGARAVDRAADAVTFAQRIRDDSSGYGYAYTKTVRLVSDRPEMRLEHRLENIGTRRIESRVYNHNFLALDGLPTGPGFVVRTPYVIQSTRPPNPELAEIRGREVVYLRPLVGAETVSAQLGGFGDTAADYDFRIEHDGVRAGIRMQADRPLVNAVLWSMKATIGLEPFIAMAIDPGQTFSWTLTYTYYQVDAGR